MEIDLNRKAAGKSLEGIEQADLIKVRAIISCPNGDYNKKFRNQFPRSQLELFVVAAKVFDFMTCPKCGEILKLDLEFNI
jgi:hypothetical protein